jgi:hypothetical protein
MKYIDVFEEFLKIAQEKGLTDSEKKLEENPRADSLDEKAIEALYNTKPETPNKYENNILELAHPDPVVIAPSYDALNGLIENTNERHNIIHHIMQTDPNGQLTNKKYAEQQLLLALVRLGNTLDNENKTDLRKLTDVCLVQTSNQIKTAVVPLAAGPMVALIVAPIAISLGAIYLQQHVSFINEGFKHNHDKLIAEIDDLLEASSSWGIGRQYTQKFLSQMQDLKLKLNKVYNSYNKIVPVLDSLEQTRTAEELLELSKSSDFTTIKNAYNSFGSIANDLLPYLLKVKDNFKNEIYKAKQIEDEGWIESLVDKTQILHGGHGLVSDDFDDVNRALDPYIESVKQILKTFDDAQDYQKYAQNQLDKYQQTYEEKSEEPHSDSLENSPKNILEDNAEKLNQQLSGLL